jgi:ATP-dependent Clp protease ATP-binding subunit ClpX
MKWLARIFGQPRGEPLPPGEASTDTTVCSFCRHSWSEVGPLVASPAGVFICDACIDHCRAVLDEEKRRRESPSATFNASAPRTSPEAG